MNKEKSGKPVSSRELQREKIKKAFVLSSGKRPVQEPSLIKRKTRIWLFVAMIAGAVLYIMTIGFDFTLDDEMYTTQNSVTEAGLKNIKAFVLEPTFSHYKKIQLNSGIYRPVTLLTFGIEKQITGTFSPFTGHLVNVILYVMILYFTGIFLLRICNRKELPEVVPFSILFLFALHPLHSEVVASIKSRDSLLSCLFLIIAMVYFTSNLEKRNIKSIIWSAFFIFLSVSSKEDAIPLIFLPFLTGLFIYDRKFKESKQDVLIFLIPCIIYFFLRQSILETQADPTQLIANNILWSTHGIERFSTNLYIWLYYIRLLIMPYPLSYDYSFNQIPVTGWNNPWVCTSLIFFLFLIIYCIRNFSRHSIVVYGILFYFLSFSIFSNLIVRFTVGSTLAERFMFIPSLAFCIVIVLVVYRMTGYLKINATGINKLLICFTITVSAIYFTFVFLRVQVWENSTTLYESGVMTAPDSFRTHNFLAKDLMERAEKLSGIKEGEFSFNHNEGVHQLYRRAIREYERMAEIMVTNSGILDELAICYFSVNDTTKSIMTFKSALGMNDEDAIAAFKLGYIFSIKKDFTDAITYTEKALVNHYSDSASAYNNLGSFYAILANYERAYYYSERAFSIRPDRALIYNLIQLCMILGKKDKEEYYSSVLRNMN